MKTHSGKAKVRDDSNNIYAGNILNINSIYIEYKNGNGMGVYADGTREYKLSLIGTPFVKSHNYTMTVLHDTKLEIIELNETICAPFSEDEADRLVTFIQQDPNRTLEDFIKANTHPSVLPIPDLSTIFEGDEEWEKNNLKFKI